MEIVLKFVSYKEPEQNDNLYNSQLSAEEES